MEILIVMGILGFVLTLGSALIFTSLRASEKARVQQVAGRLAQEEMESATALAGGAWHKLYCPPDGDVSGNCASQKGSANKYYATSTLMAYWPMDELSGTAVSDVSGFGNNGTASGATATTSGYAYNARQFNGTSDYISATSTNNSLSVGTAVTLEAWVYPNTVVASNQTFLAKRGATTDNASNYALRTGTGATANQIEFYYYGGAAWHIYTTSNADLATSTWAHLAATFTFGTGSSIKIYKNGVLLSGSWTTGTGAVPVTLNGTPVTLGGLTNGQYFNGLIDEVRVFNRALPLYEIQQHYLKAKDVISKTPLAGQESLNVSGNNYTRYFTVDNVSRDLATQAIESTYTASRDDPSTQKVTVYVSAAAYLATSTITQYFTRFKNETFFQTDWACGLSGETPSTEQPCGYASSSGEIVIGSALQLAVTQLQAGIDSVFRYAWNDVIGWIDFYSAGNVYVYYDRLEGYANSSVGAIALNCNSTPNGDICESVNNFKVSNDGSGNLSGWAYSDSIGWISFDCHNQGTCADLDYQVTVNLSTGDFTDWAWNDIVGWISFNCNNTGTCNDSNYKLKMVL